MPPSPSPAAAAMPVSAAAAVAADEYTPRSILITGAAGFIASHVTNRLVREHPTYRVVALDKLDYCGSVRNLSPATRSSPSFSFVRGDVGSTDLVLHLLAAERIDTVLHFAAQTHVDNSFGNSLEFTKSNVLATHSLLESCRLHGLIRRFVHVSTDEVYGETGAAGDAADEEESRLLPSNPYSASKAAAEMLVMAYARSYGIPAITTRGNNVYGPRQFPEKLIPKFILLAIRGEPLPVHGDGSHVRSYLYVEDVAEAFDVLLHRGHVGGVYNIGTTRERRVVDVARHVCGMFGLDPEVAVTAVSDRPFNDRRYFIDDKKLKALGWEERTPWEEGMRKTVEWYVKHGEEWWGDVSAALLPHPRMLTPQQNFDTMAMNNFDFE